VLGEREKTALRLVPEQAWQIAIDSAGEVRERRAGDANAYSSCAHRACWIEEAHVTELTGLLREGPGGDQLAAWPASMRVFARRERPHPGAQLTLLEAADGWRYSLWATNRPVTTKGWLGQNAYIDAAHRVHARVEDAIRTGRQAGLDHFPSFDYQVNAAWLTAAMTGRSCSPGSSCWPWTVTWPGPSPRRCATGCCTPRPGWCAAGGGAA
jgi:hypothetical protein